MEKLLRIDEYKERYLSYVEELCDYFSDYEEIITTIANLIRDDVEADPTAFYTIEQFESNFTASGNDLSQNIQTGTNNNQIPNNRPLEMPAVDGTETPTGEVQTKSDVDNQLPRNEKWK